MFTHKQPIGTEERYNHGECKDTRERLYVKRIKKGWVWHCFNCGDSGFKPSNSNSLSDLKERIHNAKNKIYTNSDSPPVGQHLCLPYDFTSCLPLLGIHWLNKYGITEVEAVKYHFGFSEKLNRLILPLYDEQSNLIFWQGRGLARPTKDFPKYINMRGPKGKYATFKGQLGDHSKVCLVEDILSAIKVGEVVDSIPILGSYISNSLLTYLEAYERVYLWLDYDKKFESLKYSRRIRLLTGKPCHSIITTGDPKIYSTEEINGYIGKG